MATDIPFRTDSPPAGSDRSCRVNSELNMRRVDVDSKPTRADEGGGSRLINLGDGVNEATSTRPSLANSKFQTEMSKPGTESPIRLSSRRRSTGLLRLSPGVMLEDASSAESSEWSTDDEDRSGPVRRHKTPSRSGPNMFQPGETDWQRDEDHAPSSDGICFRRWSRVIRDGRLRISLNEKANKRQIRQNSGQIIRHYLNPQHPHKERAIQDARQGVPQDRDGSIPRLNIVIMVIGSRGDIQPFLKIGKILKEKHRHRVRIASHPTFRKFVEEEIGLEFFSVGGDPSELMAFMVKNPGLIPSLETIKAGEVHKRRESMYEMFQGFWRACINATDDEKDTANLDMMSSKYPFVADAIIANPPSFAHYHCAEKLGVPLHLIFTFPYTPTEAFPHPLANIKATNVDQNYTNLMSYPLVDLMTWQGLGDVVNRFRIKTLGLDPISTLWAPGQFSRLKIPVTYLWSPGLVPKPDDWGPEIDIAGYVFLELASSFKPEPDLVEFLERKDSRKIAYIGFGSISGLRDPVAFTKIIFNAVDLTGVRAVVSRGWGGMGDGVKIPDAVYIVDNVPHDWLFPKVDIVIHHGGAGTTAVGLKCGKPTMIVPFFGDQPFWGARVADAGAGAKQCLPLKKLNVENFAAGIRECLSAESELHAKEIAKSIALEGDGAINAVDSFHRCLPLGPQSQSKSDDRQARYQYGRHSMRCSILHDRVATWCVNGTHARLCALAAELLVENDCLKWHQLGLARHYEWNDFRGPGEPVTGAAGAALASLHEAVRGIIKIREKTKKDYERYERTKRRKKRRTVADAVVLPGQIGHAIRGQSTIESVKSNYAKAKNEVNLEGEAQPSKFMSQAHNGQLGLSRTITPSNVHQAKAVILKDVGEGIAHSAKAVVSVPFDVWYALALGFRNAPRLYGDPTVRPPPDAVKGLRSGLKVAGSELGLGLYDGLTGVWRNPYQGVKDEGLSGFPKGFAQGLGGLVLKPAAGIFGVGAYTERGIRMEWTKRTRDTKKIERWIRRARMRQGANDMLEYESTLTVGQSPSTVNNEESSVEKLRSKVLAQWESSSTGSAVVQDKTRGKLLLLAKQI